MLIQFRFMNFRSFRDDTTLDLTATKVSEYSNHIIRIGREKVLPVAAIFGSNASGKTNVLEAFSFMANYVRDSFTFGGTQNDENNHPRIASPTPFLFESNANLVSTFEVHFVAAGTTRKKFYNYGFSVDNSGICEEWLNYKSISDRGNYRRILYRKGDSLDLPGITVKQQENIKIALEKETLIVSLGAKLKVGTLKTIRDWFINCVFADFGHPIKNLILSRKLPADFVKNNDIRQRVIDYLATFDPSIVDFKLKLLEQDDRKNDKEYYLEALHKKIGSDETIAISMEYESAGTKKMFTLYPLLEVVLQNGGILIIDELNASLHPLLARIVVSIFLNPEMNPNHAQIIFTTHDAWQLDSNLLRRDEIWFTEKDPRGVSALYSLADFVDDDGKRIRKDENYIKNYLLGKYGAIPTLRNFRILKEERA